MDPDANTSPPSETFPKTAWAWLALPLIFGGCAAFELTDELYREAKRTARMLAIDPGEPEFESTTEDPWSAVRTEGRAGQTPVVENDDWWGKYIMSERARQIERNLGVE